jgi:cysteine desulfurase/selenocysteine lyase
MVPYESGGGMIRSVTNSQTIFANPPGLFEAGTPHLAGVAGLDAAIDFLHTIRQDDIQRHIKEMNVLTRDALDPIEGLELLPGGTHSSGILSFYMPSIHPHDIATFLDQRGIAVRAGHHCTEPLMRALNIPGTVRVSFSVFNHHGEIGRLVDALIGIKKIFG